MPVYYWTFLKHFGRQVWADRGRDFVGSLILSCITFGVTYGLGGQDSGLAFQIAVVSLIGWLAVFALGHLVKTPHTLHTDRAAEDAARAEHWGVGVFGLFVLLLIAAGIGAMGVLAWQRHTAPCIAMYLPSADPGAKDAVISQCKAQIAALSAPEPANSLRRRTMALAAELEEYLEARDAKHPEVAYPNSSNPNISDEQKQKIAAYQKYQDDTLRYYRAHFMDRLASAVQEYKAKGIDVRFFEGYTLQNMPFYYAPESVAAAQCEDIVCRFRELAYHIDAHDNRIDLH